MKNWKHIFTQLTVPCATQHSHLIHQSVFHEFLRVHDQQNREDIVRFFTNSSLWYNISWTKINFMQSDMLLTSTFLTLFARYVNSLILLCLHLFYAIEMFYSQVNKQDLSSNHKPITRTGMEIKPTFNLASLRSSFCFCSSDWSRPKISTTACQNLSYVLNQLVCFPHVLCRTSLNPNNTAFQCSNILKFFFSKYHDQHSSMKNEK